jgi:hypothetical protein
LLDGREVFIDPANPDDLTLGIFQRQLGGVIPGDSPVRVDQSLDFAHHWLSGFNDSLFILKGLFCRLLRPKIEIAFPDEIQRVRDVHVFSDRAAGAYKMTLQIFEIDLVGGVLEQEPEEILS